MPTTPPWWDAYSDQPYMMRGQRKGRFSAEQVAEYTRILGTALALAPAVVWRYFFTTPKTPLSKPSEFVGLGVSQHHKYNQAIPDLIHELDVNRLLIRVPLWDIKNLNRYVSFADSLGDRHIVVNILQDRDSVRQPSQWRRGVYDIVSAFQPVSTTFQLGNAINRTKWGCRHTGEYLQMAEIGEEVKQTFPGITLIGSSVIDFEPLVTLRTLCNFHAYNWDACAAQLYVNRRGSPRSRQFGLFDLEAKIRLIAGMLSLSNRCANRLYITETNWPLLNTRPYTPNSGHPRSTVDESTQAEYLKDYFITARNSRLVNHVYWWQLINPGYGLIDDSNGNLRKLPSFYAFKELATGNWIEDSPRP